LSDKQPIVLHSHAHFDHIGASAQFERVLVHPSEVEDLRAGYPNDRFRSWFAPTHLIGDRLPADFDPSTAQIAGCEPTGTIEDSDSFDLGGRALEAFHTPGHSPGGITLLDRASRILFPGDAIYAGPMFAYRSYSDPVAYRATLRLLADLVDHADVIYPSHNAVPLTPGEVRAMYDAYETIWSGRAPDERHHDRDVYDFGRFSYWLRPGGYGSAAN
ncbi:MAG: MBL fold metallo-hydrolase, partial [Vicinamibacterales bacterium]